MFSHIWSAKQGFSKHCDSESKDEFQQWKKQRLKKKQWKKPTYHKTNQDGPQPIQRLSNLIPCRSSILSQPFPVTFLPKLFSRRQYCSKDHTKCLDLSLDLFIGNNLPVIMVVPLETLKFEAFQKLEDVPPQPDNLHHCLPAFLLTKIRLTAGTGDSLYGSQRCSRERERLLIHAKEKEKERVAVVIERGREHKRRS